MSYLLDKKLKRKKVARIAFFIICFSVFVYFQRSLGRGLSAAAYTVFRPVVVFGNSVGRSFHNTASFFQSKKSLLKENETLKGELEKEKNFNANHNSILEENAALKDALGRTAVKSALILGSILSKPNKSPYDTLVIDAGAKDGVAAGSVVLANGNVPIGRIAEAFSDSAKVVLFSSPGEKTGVSLSGSNVSLEIIGRGGGNFEVNVPRDFTIAEGAEAVLPGIAPETVAIFTEFISDPRDSFAKALFVSPVNIEELKFVEVKK